MNVIRHDDECKQKERIEMLNAVESFYAYSAQTLFSNTGHLFRVLVVTNMTRWF